MHFIEVIIDDLMAIFLIKLFYFVIHRVALVHFER